MQRFPVCRKYHNSDMQTLSERLRFARKSAGLSQVALAKKAGVAQSTISGLETGEQTATTYLPQIAAALGVRALWLAEEKGPMRDEDAAEPPRKIEKFVVDPDLMWTCWQAIDLYIDAGAAMGKRAASTEERVRLASMLYSGYHDKPLPTVQEVVDFLEQWDHWRRQNR